jgi:thiosulfate/3-mercaptopyruvate sulfurtransferase
MRCARIAVGLLIAILPVNAANPSALANVSDLSVLLADPATVVLDTRGDSAAFKEKRLRTARYIDWDRWDRKLDTDAGVADAEWQSILDDLGISPDSKVLLYDDGRMGWSAMVWLALRRLGVADVQVIPTRSSKFFAGLPAHMFDSGPEVRAARTRSTRGNWKIRAQDGLPRIVHADDVAALISTPAPMLFDNRSLAEFDGAATADEAGVRPGHIPRAIFLPRSAFFKPDGEPMASDAVIALMKSFGADPTMPVTLYCRSGGRSSAVALLLWEAGFTNVAVYSGSWLEWGVSATRPVEKR